MPEHLDVASLQLDTVLPARRVSLEAHELSEEYVILDFEHQRVHSLNRSAYLVFQYCDGQSTVSDACERLKQDFMVAPDESSLVESAAKILFEFSKNDFW